ncbi:MAG: hypothetical protein IJW49_09415 [Clostridia bacterium]|nr:hypothetical protein [Clostridia bacterium]
MNEMALKIRSLLKKIQAPLIYVAIAIAMVALIFVSFEADMWRAGVQMPSITPETETAVVSPTEAITFFPRNLMLVQLAVIVLSAIYMKMTSKSYQIGLSFPEHKVGFIFSLVALAFAVLCAILQLTWKSAGSWHMGIMVILGIISAALFMAVGLYITRKAGLGKVAKMLIPLVGGMTVLVPTFQCVYTFFKTFLMPYPFITVSDGTIQAILIGAAILIGCFLTMFYLKTNQLLSGVLMSLIWGLAVTAFPFSSIPAQASIAVSDEVKAMLGVGTIQPNASGGYTEVITLLGAIALAVITVVFLILLLVRQEAGYPSDEAAGYEALVPSAEEIVDTKSFLRSSKSLILGLGALVAVAYLMFSMVWNNSIDISNMIIDGLEGLFNENVGAFFLMLGLLIGFIVVLALVGAPAIAFILFYKSRKNAHSRQKPVAWIFLKIFICASAVVDLVMGILVFAPGFSTFITDILPPDFYIWNHVSSEMVEAINLGLLNGEPALSYAIPFAALMFVFCAYHVLSFFVVLGMEKDAKTGGEISTETKVISTIVMILTGLVAGALFAGALWFYKTVDTLVLLFTAFAVLTAAETLYKLAWRKK